MTHQATLEAILFYKSEPVSAKELASLTGMKVEEVKECLENIRNSFSERGIVLVSNGDQYSLGTHPAASALIERIQKEEFSSELGRAGLETLAIVLYRSPVSRREIDQIRGVNSSHILRSLLIRGLIERAGDPPRVDDAPRVEAGRSFTYKPTLALFEHLGISRREDLPKYESAWKAVENFVKEENKETSDAG